MKRESGDLMDQSNKNSGAVPAAVSPSIVSENTFATVGYSTGGKAFRNRTSQKTCRNPIFYQEDFRE